jgi:hypothetical protein
MPDKKWPAGRKSSETRPAYFLSLTLENVRCFGAKQRLDLSDGSGKPSRWNVILGENGIGKTTILQTLVGFERVHISDNSNIDWPRFFVTPFGLENYLRSKTLNIAISVELTDSLTEANGPTLSANVHNNGIGYSTMPSCLPWCCA